MKALLLVGIVSAMAGAVSPAFLMSYKPGQCAPATTQTMCRVMHPGAVAKNGGSPQVRIRKGYRPLATSARINAAPSARAASLA